MEGPKFTYPRL